MRSLVAVVLASLAFAGLVGANAGHAAAAEPAPAKSACVDVEVNGYRTLSFECLSQQMAPAPDPSRENRNPALASEAIAQRPSNQLGLFNRSATSHRMGNNFGKSVLPQRPPARGMTSPLAVRP